MGGLKQDTKLSLSLQVTAGLFLQRNILIIYVRISTTLEGEWKKYFKDALPDLRVVPRFFLFMPPAAKFLFQQRQEMHLPEGASTPSSVALLATDRLRVSLSTGLRSTALSTKPKDNLLCECDSRLCRFLVHLGRF